IQSFKSKACDCCSEKSCLLNSCLLEALASLPPSMLHKILSKITFTYLPIDLIFLNDWKNEVNAIRTFRLRCYQQGNPEVIYLRGIYEYFILHLLDEGREKNHLAGERGCMLAKYVDGMMNLAFSVDHRGLVHNYPAFTREYVDQMYHELGTLWPMRLR
ncbi:hypothetical protein HID58_014529, partial [Brassica napus]